MARTPAAKKEDYPGACEAGPPQTSGDPSDRRAAIIQATLEIMREEGYAAVSSRKIAEKAGLKSKLVHYYFKTMDDLFVAVFRHSEERYFEAQSRALTSDQPLRRLWELSADATNTKITGELVALANHRKSLRHEISHASGRSRKLQAAIVERAFKEAGIDTTAFPPMLVSLMIMAMSRLLAMDSALGVSAGHSEAATFVEDMLQRLERGKALLPDDG